MNPQKRREIFRRFKEANPNPTTELEYGTPYELLVAVVLSAQATDKSVNLATRKLFPATPGRFTGATRGAAYRAPGARASLSRP